MSSEKDTHSPKSQPEAQPDKGRKRKADSMPELSVTGDAAAKSKKRRVRTTYSKEQLWTLEGYFQMHPYPDLLMRKQIATVVGVTEEKIQVWFQNRRAKKRKHQNSRTRCAQSDPPPPDAAPTSSTHPQKSPSSSAPTSSSTPQISSADQALAPPQLPAYFPLRAPIPPAIYTASPLPNHRHPVYNPYPVPPRPLLGAYPPVTSYSLPAVGYGQNTPAPRVGSDSRTPSPSPVMFLTPPPTMRPSEKEDGARYRPRVQWDPFTNRYLFSPRPV